jgi:hypothetical protein
VPYIVLLRRGRYYRYAHHGSHVAHLHHQSQKDKFHEADDDKKECRYFKAEEIKSFALETFHDAEH